VAGKGSLRVEQHEVAWCEVCLAAVLDQRGTTLELQSEDEHVVLLVRNSMLRNGRRPEAGTVELDDAQLAERRLVD
jgi:hypothetical protein